MAQIYWPLDPSRITEGYGWAAWRNGVHDGIDFGVAQGTELRATASGVVRNNDAGTAGGAGVDITTDDGWKVRHWHVSEFLVPNGSRVEAGQVIARSGGAKGTWGAGFSTGAHLHWGTQVGGRWIDPRSLNPGRFDEITPAPIIERDQEMYAIARLDDGWAGLWNMATGEVRHIDVAPDYQRFDNALELYQFKDMADFEAFKAKYPFKVSASVDAAALANAIAGKVSINVDALATAIASKISSGSSAPDVTTKAEILSAIEANYPEEAA